MAKAKKARRRTRAKESASIGSRPKLTRSQLKNIGKRILGLIEEKEIRKVATKLKDLKEDFPSFFAMGNLGNEDPELTGFRRFSKRFISTDLDDVRQDRQYVTAVTLWHKTPIARYFVNLQTAFLTTGKVQISAKDPRVKEWIDNFLKDPLTPWATLRKKAALEAVLSGELLWYPHINAETGHMRPAYLSPGFIKARPAPVKGFPHVPDRIRIKRDGLRMLGLFPEEGESDTATEKTEILRVIRSRFVQDEQTKKAVERLAGDIFFVPLNRLLSSLRGHSQLLASADQIDGVDEALFAMIERLYVLNLFCWHLQYEGLSEAQLREKERENRARGAFQPGEMLTTNEKAKLTAVAPNFGNADFVTGFDKALNVAAMSFGIPQAWLGLGDLVNRASAQVSETPIMRMLVDARDAFRGFEALLIQYHVLQGQLHGSLAGVADTSFEISYEELSKHDQTDVASALSSITGAMAVAIDRQLLTQEQANVLTKFVAEQIVKLPDGTASSPAAPAPTEPKASDVNPGASGGDDGNANADPARVQQADEIGRTLQAAAEARRRSYADR